VTLNQKLMEYGRIEKDVVLVGMIDHLQVWDRDRWMADQDELPAEIEQIAESLGNPS
jgi:transcriptional regulator MraZ